MATKKASKKEAGYHDSAYRNHCQDCAHFRGGTCTKVEGGISPSGTCTEYFEPVKRGGKGR